MSDQNGRSDSKDNSEHNAKPQRGGYPGKVLSPEEMERSIEATLLAIRERFGERTPDVLRAALMHAEVTYDSYIETPTLLSLQRTLTDYHDELVFKVYHQQTELWFRLILHEIERAIRSMIVDGAALAVAMESIKRINRYFSVLSQSYCVMLDGLSVQEFLEFRKAFGTSSGFQSSQFRAIEILAGMQKEGEAHRSSESRPQAEQRATHQEANEQAEYYWERAARHITTNEPTLTLLKFKEKHLQYLNELYKRRTPYSLRFAFLKLAEDRLGPVDDPVTLMSALLQSSDPDLILLAEELLRMDDAIVDWKQAHLKVAAKHLARAPKGTGETNWAEYLSRSIREQRCFPELHKARIRIDHTMPAHSEAI